MLPEKAKVKGIVMALGGEDYLFAPLSLGSLEQLQDGIGAMDEKQAMDNARVVIDMAWHSLLRNYPAFERQEVANLVGLENMLDIARAVMDVSGTLRKEMESKAGEARLGA